MSTVSTLKMRDQVQSLSLKCSVPGSDPLKQISPLFSVLKTRYGGRGCFANEPIPKGTVLLVADTPVGTAVSHSFRKEVCMHCFKYLNGKTLKHRLNDKLYFCSTECKDEFSDVENLQVLIEALAAVEFHYSKCKVDLADIAYPLYTPEHVSSAWEEVDAWTQQISRMKSGKRLQQLPKITSDDYCELKYVIRTLFSMFQNPAKSNRFIEDQTAPQRLALELELFNLLQLSELQKVEKYPYLVHSYANIYKFARIVCPLELQPFVTPQNVRDIIGKNLTNAFGIWSPTKSPDEEKEYFGFGVYPSASFFNHSCNYNVVKKRVGGAYIFTAKEDIEPGTELSITYGIKGDELLQQRQEALTEWFFTCSCSKCLAEAP